MLRGWGEVEMLLVSEEVWRCGGWNYGNLEGCGRSPRSLYCHRVRVVPPQYDVRPVYTLPPVLLTSLCRDGSPCIPTPGVYQSGDRGVTAPASGLSTQECAATQRVWQDYCSGPGGLPISTEYPR